MAVFPCHPGQKPARFRHTGDRPQGLDINQTDVGHGLRRSHVKQHFINELAADAAMLDGQILQFNEPLQVNTHLG